jgi:hypothetical protein
MRLIEGRVVGRLAGLQNIPLQEALQIMYESKSYEHFLDPSTLVAREGPDALVARIIAEKLGKGLF